MHETDESKPGPQLRSTRVRLALAGTAVVALIFLAGTVAAPMLEQAGSSLGPWLRSLYAPACHQISERSLAVAGSTQAVCARCAGLYFGGLIGVLAGGLVTVLRRRIRAAWLVWAFAPSIVDFGSGLLGLPSLPNVPRLLLALPAGLVVGVFLAIAVRDLAGRANRVVSAPYPSTHETSETRGPSEPGGDPCPTPNPRC